jgi:hypothetical protein
LTSASFRKNSHRPAMREEHGDDDLRVLRENTTSPSGWCIAPPMSIASGVVTMRVRA